MANELINSRIADEPRESFHPAGLRKGTAHRGFAAMSTEQQKQIASKGGEAVSRNREHMAEIGKKGGEIVSQNRKHMSEIGRKGGEASKASRNRQ
jgi:general stress protein YciG